MTFEEAERKLANFARGRYHSLSYELTTFSSGNREAECMVYVDGLGQKTGPTWATALGLIGAIDYSSKEAPAEELGEKGVTENVG